MTRQILVNVILPKESFTIDGLKTMRAAKREARRVYEHLADGSCVEVIRDGCVKKVYGSLVTRRRVRGYVPASDMEVPHNAEV